MNKTVSMLDQNAVLVADGGGKVLAAVKPIFARDRVVKFLFGVVRKASMVDRISHIEISEINGQPALILRSNEGIHTVGILHVENSLIPDLYIVRNPDKLKHVRV
jgi:hypothetical protein